eukprot:5575497-Ditylum_brightwellii.AAC.1
MRHVVHVSRQVHVEQVYNKKAKRCTLSDPSRCRVVSRNANICVDDVKLLHNNDDSHISAQELKHQ